VSDRRRDWREQLTTALVQAYDLIAVEALQVQAMMRRGHGRGRSAKAGLNRAIGEQGWSAFRRRLQEKASMCGVEVVEVDPAYTSQRCQQCGYTARDNRQSQAVFQCGSCGHTAHADQNAAQNILAAGLAVSGRGGGCTWAAGEPSTAWGVV